MDQASTVAPHETPAHSGDFVPKILIPFDAREAVSLPIAAKIATRSERTVRSWCVAFTIGRKIGGHWAVSRIALAMYLEGDKDALKAYLLGARGHWPAVTAYYKRLGLIDLIKAA
jgi:hypothetical protein